jgi:hypothetical protein
MQWLHAAQTCLLQWLNARNTVLVQPNCTTTQYDTASYDIYMLRETMVFIIGDLDHVKTCLTTQCLPIVGTTMENYRHPPTGHNTTALNLMYLPILHGLTASKHEDLPLAYPSRSQELYHCLQDKVTTDSSNLFH